MSVGSGSAYTQNCTSKLTDSSTLTVFWQLQHRPKPNSPVRGGGKPPHFLPTWCLQPFCYCPLALLAPQYDTTSIFACFHSQDWGKADVILAAYLYFIPKIQDCVYASYQSGKMPRHFNKGTKLSVKDLCRLTNRNVLHRQIYSILFLCLKKTASSRRTLRAVITYSLIVLSSAIIVHRQSSAAFSCWNRLGDTAKTLDNPQHFQHDYASDVHWIQTTRPPTMPHRQALGTATAALAQAASQPFTM